jgi:amino acid permease
MLLNLKGISEASGTNNLSGSPQNSGVADYYSRMCICPAHQRKLFKLSCRQRQSCFAFIRFNTVVMAEEVKDPVKNVPRAILFAFTLCTLIYIGISVVAVGMVNWTLLGTSTASAGICIEDRH